MYSRRMHNKAVGIIRRAVLFARRHIEDYGWSLAPLEEASRDMTPRKAVAFIAKCRAPKHAPWTSSTVALNLE